MTLIAGTRLGAYHVTAQIGAGGMGEVYAATHTNLGRQVALKVLPDSFASDPERVAYTARIPGRATINIEPLPPNGSRYQVGSNGHHPLWSRDGRRIVYFPGPSG